MKHTYIGIDGGATKVAGAVVLKNENGTFEIENEIVEINYHDCPSYSNEFSPVNIDIQLDESNSGSFNFSIEEERQGIAYAEACEEVIISVLKDRPSKHIYIGLGMPGTKTEDKRGIKVMNNGPRIPRLLDVLERRLVMADHEGISVNTLSEDNDLCGMGELYSENGEFRGTQNALYIGGGTGIADVMLINGEHVPFLSIKDWMPRTWQMLDYNGLSYELLTSHLGIMNQYSSISGKPIHELKQEKIFPQMILDKNREIRDRFITGLSELIIKRIHLFYENKGLVFDKIICALRLGSLLNENADLFQSVNELITQKVEDSEILNNNSKERYQENKFLRISHLKHAPIIGGGVQAYFDSNT